MYTCFKRRWWQSNPEYPDGLEPDPKARKTWLAVFDSAEKAREFCQEWNETHPEGRYSVKAEFTAGGI